MPNHKNTPCPSHGNPPKWSLTLFQTDQRLRLLFRAESGWFFFLQNVVSYLMGGIDSAFNLHAFSQQFVQHFHRTHSCLRYTRWCLLARHSPIEHEKEPSRCEVNHVTIGFALAKENIWETSPTSQRLWQDVLRPRRTTQLLLPRAAGHAKALLGRPSKKGHVCDKASRGLELLGLMAVRYGRSCWFTCVSTKQRLLGGAHFASSLASQFPNICANFTSP